MTVTLTYDTELSRVRIDASALDLSATTADVERSIDGVTWTAVRGGLGIPVTSGSFDLPVNDYEFIADVVNTYRVTAYDASLVQTNQETNTITPVLDRVWIKSIARPYLNREVIVADFSEITRAPRTGVFDIVGRSFPVAVSDVRSGKTYTLEILTETSAEERDFDLLLASGDPIFVHVPASSMVPDGYYTIGQTTNRRLGRTSVKRVFTLPLTEIAAPGPDLVGAAGTWQTILNDFATWQAVLDAFPIWEDVLEYVASPSEVIVP
jgi:hypothetical protein